MPVQDCPNGTIVDENGCTVCKEGCDENTQHSCTNGTDTWCCNNGQSCGSNKGECNTCDPASAKNNETLCEACGWDWTAWKILTEPGPDGKTSYYQCGGNAFCDALSTNNRWKCTYQNNNKCTTYECVEPCTNGGIWTCISYMDGLCYQMGCGGQGICISGELGEGTWICPNSGYCFCEKYSFN